MANNLSTAMKKEQKKGKKKFKTQTKKQAGKKQTECYCRNIVAPYRKN
jgi:hypothetical protein